ASRAERLAGGNLGERIPVSRALREDALEAAPAVAGTPHVREGAVLDRAHQPARRDVFEDLHGAREDLVRAALDASAGLDRDLVAEVSRRTHHVTRVF